MTSNSVRRTITRRNVLARLGAGTAFLSPLLRAVRARAAGVVQGNLLIFYTPNGHYRAAFGATGAGADFALKPALQPLQPFRKELTMLGHVDQVSPSSKRSHEDAVRTLTCVSGPDIFLAYGPSIDHVVAGHLGGRPLTLGTPRGGGGFAKISWQRAKQVDLHISDPREAFQRAFGALTPVDNSAEAASRLAQGKSVLDFVSQDVTILRDRLRGEERAKLESHVEALRELEKSIGATPPAGCRSAEIKSRVEQGSSSRQQHIELLAEVAIAAFACGLRRAATVCTEAGGHAGYNPFGGMDHHGVSHHMGADPRGVWQKLDRWYAERYAGVLERLGRQGLLSSTIVPWCTEISEGHDQIRHVVPVAGGSALGFRGEQAINDRRVYADLWVSVQKALGKNSDAFGDPGKTSGGIDGLS